MWPFGKKKEKTVETAESQRNAQVQEFAQNFLPEEFTLLALTGSNTFNYVREAKDGLSVAGIGLIAWLRDGEEEVHQEEASLLTLADDRLITYLRDHVPRNFIIKATVRAAKDGTSFQLVGMPEPAFDPDLKAILEERKKPVTLDGGDLGTFTLNRAAGWFGADLDWNGVATNLIFASAEEAAPCLDTARALLADPAGWDEKIRSFTAETLFPEVLPLAEEGGEELTEEELAQQLDPDFLMVHPDGSFELWYGDGGIFWGRSIKVAGTVSDGITEAILEE